MSSSSRAKQQAMELQIPESQLMSAASRVPHVNLPSSQCSAKGGYGTWSHLWGGLARALFGFLA